MFVCAAIYYFKSGELLAPFCFFSGALLAELSLNQGHTPPNAKWPFALTVLSLLLASVPPENPHFRPYSRFLWFWFDDHITTTGGTSSYFLLMKAKPIVR
jgi:hypothetical protein